MLGFRARVFRVLKVWKERAVGMRFTLPAPPFSSPFFCQSPLSRSLPSPSPTVLLEALFFGGSRAQRRKKRKKKKKKKKKKNAFSFSRIL